MNDLVLLLLVAGHIIIPIIGLVIIIVKILNQRKRQQVPQFSENPYIPSVPPKSAGWGRLLLVMILLSSLIEFPWAALGFWVSIFTMDAPGSSDIFFKSATSSVFIGILLNIIIIIICLIQKLRDRNRLSREYY